MKRRGKVRGTYMNQRTKDEIANALFQWKKGRGFLEPGCSVKSISQELGYNPKYISYVVNTVLGMRVDAYLAQLRIEFLIEYLKKHKDCNPVNLGELADMAGFKSYHQFMFYVKKLYGSSPRYFFFQFLV